MQEIEIISAMVGGVALQWIQERFHNRYEAFTKIEKLLLSFLVNFLFAIVIYIVMQMQTGAGLTDIYKLIFNFCISYASNQIKHRIQR